MRRYSKDGSKLVGSAALRDSFEISIRRDSKAEGASRSADEPEVRWDFSADIGSERIRDVGPLRLEGVTHQMPARATGELREQAGEDRRDRQYANGKGDQG